MSNITSRTVKLLLALVVGLLGVVGLATPGIAAESAADRTALAQAACGDTSGFDEVSLSGLPAQAGDTVELIQRGGPFPYPQDDIVYENREALLPACQQGYYHVYTVETPGSDDRGDRRIVTGEDGEFFYTDDHYGSFVLVDING
jgi:ribonuclease T1